MSGDSDTEDYTSLLPDNEDPRDISVSEHSSRREGRNRPSSLSESFRGMLSRRRNRSQQDVDPERASLLDTSESFDQGSNAGDVITEAERAEIQRSRRSLKSFSDVDESDSDDDDDSDESDEDQDDVGELPSTSERYGLVGRSAAPCAADDDGLNVSHPLHNPIEGFGNTPTDTTVLNNSHQNPFQNLLFKIFHRTDAARGIGGVVIGQGLNGLRGSQFRDDPVASQDVKELHKIINNLQQELRNANLQVQAWKTRTKELQKEVRRLRGEDSVASEDSDDTSGNNEDSDDDDEIEYQSSHSQSPPHPGEQSPTEKKTSETTTPEEEPLQKEGVLIDIDNNKQLPVFDPLDGEEKTSDANKPVSEYEKDINEAFGSFVSAEDKAGDDFGSLISAISSEDKTVEDSSEQKHPETLQEATS